MMRIHHLSWSSLLFLLSSATQVSSQTDTCSINCHPGSTCIQGNADFSFHPKDKNGVAFDFLKETNVNGWYCECPENMAGLRCNRPYEKCEDSDHFCYHGGKCIEGMNETVVDADLLFCDCSDAEHNGTPYVGKYCEVEGATECGDTEIFCTNQGTCKDDFEIRAYPCECKTGHRGPHCEFDTGFVPDCDLECENSGDCQLGIKDYDTAIHSEFWARHDGNFMYCDCPEGFFGPKCEVPGAKCGDNTCFNGATCLETEHSDGNVEFTCDCSTANTDEKSFAGEFCENESSTYCDKTVDENGQLFCVNGGTCKEEEHTGCDCPDGFHGPICEFRDGQDVDECKLQCQNGGKCRSGKKDNQLFEQFGDELKKFNETHRLWEHCVCPEGYFGIQCEHQLEICPGGEHVCLHGSKCVRDQETEKEAKHTCDCDEADTSNEQYAGRFCQYTSTDLCTKNGKPGVGKANFAFCVNNGKCNARVGDNEPHPGCTCTKGFKGPHCEFLDTDAFASASTTNKDGLDQDEGLVILLAIALLLLVALVGGALLRKHFASTAKQEDPLKEDPMDVDTQSGSGVVAEETVDMQSPGSSNTPSMEPREFQTVEII